MKPTRFFAELIRRFSTGLTGLLLAGLLGGAGASSVRAQIYVSSPDNNLSGTSYFSGSAEIGGNGFVDGNLLTGNLSVGQNIFAAGNLYVNNLYASHLYYNNYDYYSNLTITGGFELFSNFSWGGLDTTWGMGGSWLHSGLDFGDLTYTGVDTPAYNVSQYYDGTNYYPTINFTGYDANTTWVWQQGGLNAMANSTAPVVQMALDGNSNLTLNSPGSGNSILLNPGSGQIQVNNPAGTLTISDSNANSVTIDASTQTVSFHSTATGGTVNVTPQGIPLVFVTTNNGQALGTGATVTGNSAFALGNDVAAAGDGSFALGNNLTAAYANSVVVGQWNASISGSSTGNVSNSPTDPLFVIGNGADSAHLSNALVILKNGDTTLNGNTTINGNATINGVLNAPTGAALSGNVSVQPQGDILMGQFH